MRNATAAAVVLALLLPLTNACANPVPDPGEQMYSVYWLMKTLPVNYAVDLIALCLALLVSAGVSGMAWRMVPVYNVVVVIAGYLSDWGGAMISQYQVYYPRAKDPVADLLIGYFGNDDLSQFTFVAGAFFIATTAALIYLSNLAIISGILRLNDVEAQGRLHLAAAIMAVVTSPYVVLRGDAKAAWIVPILLVLLTLLALLVGRRFLDRRKLRNRA